MCVSPRLRSTSSIIFAPPIYSYTNLAANISLPNHHTLPHSSSTCHVIEIDWSLFFSFCSGLWLRFHLIVVLFFLGLNQVPFLLALDCNGKRSVVVASTVVANASVPPKLVDEKSTSNHVRVVKLVIVANPWADKSPGCLYSGVTAEARSFCWLAT